MSVSARAAGRLTLEAVAVAFVATAGLLAGRQVLIGEWASGLLVAGSAGLLVLVWRRRRPAPAGVSMSIGLALAFAVWSTAFIALCSAEGPDGRRYFVLFDDAFISLRYAWNLAHGQGLVWNPGERVEGFTNLLMTLLMAIPARFLDRSHAALAVQVAGVASMLAAALVARRLASRLAAPPTAVFAAVLACYPLAYWTLLGMETGLLAVLLLLACVVAADRPAGPDLRLPLVLGLTIATRPDAMVPALALLAFRAATTDAPGRRAVAIEASWFAAFPLAIAAFRWFYYGSFVPNTYVLKIEGLPLGYRLRMGAESALPYLAWLAPAVALVVAGLCRRPDRTRMLLLTVWVSSLVSHVFMGGDAWPRWRFLSPATPLLLVLAADGAWRVLARPGRSAVACVALALSVTAGNGRFLSEAFLARYPFGVTEGQVNVRVAVTLARICTPEATVGVFYAGAVPYYTGLRAIDFLGKTDPHVARRAPNLAQGVGHNKSDLVYSIGERKPDYVEDFSWGADDARQFLVEYEKVGELWLRRGSPNVRWALVRGGR